MTLIIIIIIIIIIICKFITPALADGFYWCLRDNIIIY